jgi:hypothetical protein
MAYGQISVIDSTSLTCSTWMALGWLHLPTESRLGLSKQIRTTGDSMDNVERIYQAARATGTDPDDPEAWDRALLDEAVRLGEEGLTLTFRPNHEESHLLSAIAQPDVDVMSYDGQQVTVVSNTGEVDPGDGEQLWFVKASDGVIFAAWISELGL